MHNYDLTLQKSFWNTSTDSWCCPTFDLCLYICIFGLDDKKWMRTQNTARACYSPC